MGECINLRRGGKAKALPVLNPNFPADYSCMTNNGTHTFNVEFAEHGYPADYTYKWYWDGAVLDWATKETCTVSLGHGASTHTIYCEVTNKAGTVRSRTATITFTAPYLYSWGNEYTSVTGGWQLSNALDASNPSYARGTLKKDGAGLLLHLWTNGTQDGYVHTVNKIDLTHYSKIQFTVNHRYTNDEDYKWYFCTSNAYGGSGVGNYVTSITTVHIPEHVEYGDTQYYVVDLSNVTGSHHIGFYSWMYIGESKLRVCEVYLVP